MCSRLFFCGAGCFSCYFLRVNDKDDTAVATTIIVHTVLKVKPCLSITNSTNVILDSIIII